jgi:hypothetical protein
MERNPFRGGEALSYISQGEEAAMPLPGYQPLPNDYKDIITFQYSFFFFLSNNNFEINGKFL